EEVRERAAADVRRRIAKLHSLLESLPLYADDSTAASAPIVAPGRVVFVVHGHDHKARDAVVNHLGSRGLEARVLAMEATGGLLTLVEKLEANAEGVGAAVVIVTPDDPGTGDGLRARQN